MSKALLYIIMALGTVASLPAQAARTMVAPRFAWHDWYYTKDWCDGTSSSNGEYKNIEMSLNNASNATQTVTITCTPYNMTSGSAVTGNQPLIIKIDIGNGESSSTAPVSRTVTMGPNASASVTCSAIYRGAAGGGSHAGDWHMMGAFDIKFDIQEDRGAVTAVLLSQMESSGCAITQQINFSNPAARSQAQIDSDEGIIEATMVSTMRNASRTILVNGGRPF